MARMPILQKEEKSLRAAAEPVPASLVGTKELAGILSDLADTLDAEPDGVAIAAPQAGIPYRIFLVRYDRMLPAPKEGEPPRPPELGVFINPSIARLSKRSRAVDEGCLSVRGLYGKVKRKERATVRALDEHGKPFERGGGGVLAQAFQHEIDHLDGVLFIDKATDFVETEVPGKDESHD